MDLQIEASIFYVDGRTQVLFRSNSILEVLEFFRTHDHEGSAIDIKIVVHNEDVYGLLESLRV